MYARLEVDIWAIDLCEMESLSSMNQDIKYLLCVIDVFTKYTWIKPSKDEKSKAVLLDFIKTVNESNCKPKKI